MEIRLDNIGIIKDSALSLDGLTVVVGKNNSGKTTVSKAVYSILDAVYCLPVKAKNDRDTYIYKQIDTVMYTMDILRNIVMLGNKDEKIMQKMPAIKSLFSRRYLSQPLRVQDPEAFAHQLHKELIELDTDSVITKYNTVLPSRVISRRVHEPGDISVNEVFKKQHAKALAVLKQLFSDLEKDPELIAYARESINQTLNVVFDGQIQPVRFPDAESSLVLLEDDKAFIKFQLDHNNVIDTGNPVYCGLSLPNAFLIDDPFVLDSIGILQDIYVASVEDVATETVLNSARIRGYNVKLANAIKMASSRMSVFEQTVLNDTLKPLQEKMDAVIPGAIEFSPNGNYYVQDGVKLKLRNLATGSKLFSIIKILLNSGQLTKDTMLILDEPEAHLHPQWQNAFAEIIVLLLKELGVRILLTTHSPNFVLALDANMRKYGVTKKTNFYQTKMLEDGMVQYCRVNDNIGEIYNDFVKYLSEAKVVRDTYLRGGTK